LEVLRLEPFDVSDGADARVRDDDVEPAEAFHGFGDRVIDLAFVADVALDRKSAGAESSSPHGNLLEPIDPPGAEDDVMPLSGELENQSLADAGGRSGHQSHRTI